MQIYKVINNNMVSVRNDKGQEIMLKGLAIGYRKKAGDTVDEDKIELRFVLENEVLTRQFDEMIMDVDKDVIDVCVNVISALKENSDLKLSDSIYVTLIDHVNNLIDRLSMGIKFDNSILWDIRRIYPTEYELAKEAVKGLNEGLPYTFDDDEANFIALHIVNAGVLQDMNKTYRLTNVINDICGIVTERLGVEFSESDYHYNRFVMHLKFLLENRAVDTAMYKKANSKVLDTLISNYLPTWKLVEEISEYIEKRIKLKLTKEEQLYLMIHLVQIFDESK